jgi:glycosyltransferase involved in cell wall biosynthesis
MVNYTVVIPAYNARQTIGETIESVLQQTVPPERVIVVDDGSTDDTLRLALEFGDCVRALTQSNQGPGAAMSLGMRQIETPIIASVDADDLWLPEKMERQLDYLQANPACAGVFAWMEHFGDCVSGTITQDGWSRTTMVIRKSACETIGDVVDPPGMRGEMIDWIARAREAGFSLQMMPEVLAKRRVHAGSLSHRRSLELDRGYLHVVRAALLRKRAQLQKEAAR